MNLETLEHRISRAAPSVDFWSARIVRTDYESLRLRQAVVQPPDSGRDLGVHLTVVHGGGVGYAATSDLRESGILQAFQHAQTIAQASAGQLCFSADDFPRPNRRGDYQSPVSIPWSHRSLEQQLDILHAASAQLKIHDDIVDWSAWLGYEQRHQIYLNSDGGRAEQIFHYLFPGLEVVACRGNLTQIRRGGGAGAGRQGGLEQLAILGFPADAPVIAEQALQLLDAPECPEGEMDLLLMPEQMVLQIHESIGHPLELDRILGDERNYAGSSFVTAEMFGEYRYGSDLLNISFDPSLPGELASYDFDDDGMPAEKAFLIQQGKLLRPLGGALSQQRADMPGVANSRASNWNRPAMDRMANLNLEPGETSLKAMIAQVEQGVMMNRNRSWSIDDHRNKFQFGCEIGWLIKDGEIQHLLRNPNYRGISANFWRHLKAVGDAEYFAAPGVPNCGKGEPNQMVYVGHASPPCLFGDVQLFGGDA
ncbi:MAG TPA: TldD/PmbA family protein [Gammaproteobacteria bacterium]|nr:TldD/PmbA family protein [Gammaproteobacteria bacterium]